MLERQSLHSLCLDGKICYMMSILLQLGLLIWLGKLKKALRHQVEVEGPKGN